MHRVLTPPFPSSSKGGEEEDGEGGEAHQDNPIRHIIWVLLVLGFIFMLFVDKVINMCLLSPPRPPAREAGRRMGRGGEAHQENPVPHIIGVSLVLGFIFMLFVNQVINICSVVDPDPDPVGSGTFCRIRIRSRIRNKSFRIWIRPIRIRNKFYT